MIADHSRTIIKMRDAEILDDYVVRVLRSVNVPVCINTIAVLTGLAPHRVCKVLNRLEQDKRIRKTTNIRHAYWQFI